MLLHLCLEKAYTSKSNFLKAQHQILPYICVCYCSVVYCYCGKQVRDCSQNRPKLCVCRTLSVSLTDYPNYHELVGTVAKKLTVCDVRHKLGKKLVHCYRSLNHAGHPLADIPFFKETGHA